MPDIIEEALQELFIAITTRWRNEAGVLAIGVERSRILEAGKIQEAVLDDLIQKLKAKIAPLGLELVEYLYEGAAWYTIRSTYIAPCELTTEEEATLAVIISQIERDPKQPHVSMDVLRKKLVGGKYFSEYQMDKILKNLVQLGYIQRKNQNIIYSPRTLIEFPEEARKHIAQESERLVL